MLISVVKINAQVYGSTLIIVGYPCKYKSVFYEKVGTGEKEFYVRCTLQLLS